jgi:gamma-glutamyltranspeptidase/glutathione hydrolase
MQTEITFRDPDFVKMPLNALMDDNYLKQRMANFSFDKATSSSDIKEGNVTYNESMETTHSIVDQFEMPLPQQRLLMRVMVQSIVMTGVFLNNEMDDFSAKVESHMFGLVGNEANSIAPQKGC